MNALLLLAAGGLLWTFDGSPCGELPPGWQARGGSGENVYRVVCEANGDGYLEARSSDDGVQLGVPVGIEPDGELELRWRWRINRLPRGGDERRLATMDSAASVYVVFGSRFFSRVIKYVWSTSVPEATVLRHPRSNRIAIVVLGSGNEGTGRWQRVRRDLDEDHRKLFGSAPGSVRAIGVKSDSDSTGSDSAADFDDIYLGKPRPQSLGEQP